jgi:hypothetical protein
MNQRAVKSKTGDEDMFQAAQRMEFFLPHPNVFDKIGLTDRRKFMRVMVKIMHPFAPMLIALKVPICTNQCSVHSYDAHSCNICRELFPDVASFVPKRNR